MLFPKGRLYVLLNWGFNAATELNTTQFSAKFFSIVLGCIFFNDGKASKFFASNSCPFGEEKAVITVPSCSIAIFMFSFSTNVGGIGSIREGAVTFNVCSDNVVG